MRVRVAFIPPVKIKEKKIACIYIGAHTNIAACAREPLSRNLAIVSENAKRRIKESSQRRRNSIERAEKKEEECADVLREQAFVIG